VLMYVKVRPKKVPRLVNNKVVYVPVLRVRTNPAKKKTVRQRVRATYQTVKTKTTAAAQKATKGTWFEKHGKTVLIAAGVAAVVGVVGVVLYYLVGTVAGALNPPANNPAACNQLTSELASLYTQINNVNLAAYKVGGSYTSQQQAEIQSLQSQAATVQSQMAAACGPSAPTPGQTLDNTLKEVGWAFALFAGGLAAIGVGAFAYRAYVWSKVYSAKNGKGNPPEDPDDVEVGDDFSPGAAGQAGAQAKAITDVDSGATSADDASTALRTMASGDPAIASADSLSASFTDLAAATSESDLAATYSSFADIYAATAADDAEAAESAIDVIAEVH